MNAYITPSQFLYENFLSFLSIHQNSQEEQLVCTIKAIVKLAKGAETTKNEVSNL